MPDYRRLAGPAALIFLLSVSCALIFFLLRASEPALEVYFLDIGQGDATLIESPAGVQVLVDGGPDSSILSELGDVMPFQDRHIDAIIATHPDADHINGLHSVLGRYTTDYFIEPGVGKSTLTYTRLTESLRDLGIPVILARRGMLLDLGGGALIEILYPDRDVSLVKDANDASVVLRLTYEGRSFLLTGDATLKVESRILSYGGFLRSDVLKVGHHGSDTSSGTAFLKAAVPEYGVISVGARNRYGHPTERVLSRIKEQGISILRTDESGRIACVVQKTNLSCAGSK